jgi:multidrug efflux pump subunit AcrA (membrane-fusion protein)
MARATFPCGKDALLIGSARGVRAMLFSPRQKVAMSSTNSRKMASPLTRKLLIAPALALGAGAFALLMITRRAPEREPKVEKARSVRVLKAPALDAVPRVVGYGAVRPGREWQAVAEVQGRIVELSPKAKEGALLPANELLIRIDAADYELAVALAKANIANAEAQLAELDAQEQNLRDSLAIEEASLALAEKELERQRELLLSKSAPQSAVEAQERAVLAQRGSAQLQRNSLRLVPSQREALRAQLSVNRGNLSSAELNLARSVVRTPFACRVTAVAAEEAQFARVGELLLSADGIDTAEIEAQVPAQGLRRMIPPELRDQALTLADGPDLAALLALEATIRLKLPGFSASWEARVERVSPQVDPKTRSLGVIVVVDDPYGKTLPGERPPLARNTFCEVELRGKPKSGIVVIPRSALRENGVVHVVREDGRLESRSVVVEFAQDDFVALSEGVSEGERVVLSDLVPAVANMLLDPVEDAAALARLRTSALTGNQAPDTFEAAPATALEASE